MRGTLHGLLSAAPTKLFGGIGWLAMFSATIWPEETRSRVNQMMEAETIQCWGIIGLVVFSLYWGLWLWARPKKQAIEVELDGGGGGSHYNQEHSGSGDNTMNF